MWNDIYSSKANCDVAIYGSSRAWVQIDPQIISDTLKVTAYNFGIDGHNFWLQYLRHRELLKHNRKPGQIIMVLDIFTLMKRNDLYQPDQFLPYMLWNQHVREFTSSFIGYDKVDYYIPLVRYGGKKDALRTCVNILSGKSSGNKFRQNGFAGRSLEWNSDLEEARNNSESYEIRIDSGSVDLLEKFIKECRESEIDLVFVYTPEYIEGQRFISNKDEVIRIYREFASKYSLDFYDYSHDELSSDKDLFYNANHLNKTGAEIFTSKLARDLNNRIAQHAIGRSRDADIVTQVSIDDMSLDEGARR